MIRKPYFWAMVAVFLAPVAFQYSLRPALRRALDDARPIYLAQPLESIQGARAGKRVGRKIKRMDISYQVKAGDSWWKIAQRFRVRDASALAKHNGNIALMPGVRLVIPAGLLE